MCPPVAIAPALMAKISLATTIASTGMSLMAQRQQAKAQAAAQRNASIRENQRYQREATAARLKEAQEDTILANEIQDAARKAQSARATAIVAAGESGVTGLSVDALVDDYTRQEANYRFALTEQARMTGLNNQLQFDEMGFRNQNNIMKINQPIKKPDYLGSMVNMAGSYMTISNQYQQNKLTEARLTDLGNTPEYDFGNN